MLDLGVVRPGQTIIIPFSTFDKDDGSSITMTNFAAADILVYKDGSTTERASTAGFTATTDFDGKTGKHVIVIDLADDTTADFWACGSEYLVAIDAVTVDAVTTGGWVARFRIGYRAAVINTTIATLASQTSFTLTAGPAEDDALNGMWCLIHDKASAVQCGWALILDYTGSTKTVTLVAGTTFTVAAKDNISIMFPAPLQPTVLGRTLDVSSTGEAGMDWANVGTPSATVNLSATTVNLVNTITTYTGNTVQTGDSYARLGAPAGASLSADIASVKVDTGTLLTRITSSLFSGITSLAQWLGLIAGKQTGNTTARTELRATGGGSGTFDETTDSIEAIRDRGDAAWVTGGGGGGTDWTADERTAIRTILGVPASGTTPDVPSAGALKVIDDYIDTEIGTLNTNLSALITTVGTAGAGLTALAPAATALSTATWTTARAGYLDALNGGIVVKRNTALANFEFLMVLSSDHVTGATGKTITATRSIDGGAFASCTNSASEVSNGVYKISLSASDLNGTTITLRFTAASCDDTFISILTQP